MIKGLIIGAVVTYFYLERPEDFAMLSQYIEGLYIQFRDWAQTLTQYLRLSVSTTDL